MQTLTGTYITDSGAQGAHGTLFIESGTDIESGSPLTWSMEKQSSTNSLPVIRATRGTWSMFADNASRCETVLGAPSA